jgi:hypothetical protein
MLPFIVQDRGCAPRTAGSSAARSSKGGSILEACSVSHRITTYLQNGGTLEHAQQLAAHESPRRTKLYDRTQDEISLDEVERIRI